MTLVCSNSMMNAGRSAVCDAGDFYSCAFFQSFRGNSMMIVGTMTVVPIFIVLALAVLCGGPARIYLAALIFLAALSYNQTET